MDYLVKFKSGNTTEITQTEFNAVTHALNNGFNFAEISNESINEFNRYSLFLLNLKKPRNIFTSFLIVKKLKNF